MNPKAILGIIIAIIVVAILLANIRVVPQATVEIIERLGKFKHVWNAGLHIKVPFIERVVRKIDLRERVADFPPQPVITKDNVTMQIDTVVFFMVTDPKLYTYGFVNPVLAIENLTATTLRNIIGELELDETLTSREIINSKMRDILDIATDPWGIRVTRVELKNIMPPRAIQESMEKQMKAERERREAILIAEGEKKSAVLRAEGEKESAVLRAEAQKIEMIKEAEGHAEAIRLHKQAESEGIVMLKKADAEGVRQLRNVGFDTEDILKLHAYDAFKTAANGKATKIIIPSEIQSITGLVAGIKGAANTEDIPAAEEDDAGTFHDMEY